MGFFNNIKNFVSKVGQKVKSSVQKFGKKFTDFTNKYADRNTTQIHDLTPEEKLHIKIAQETYKTNRDANVDGYQYITNLSNPTTAVYMNSQKHLIIGYRGTSNGQDVLTDIQYIKHKEGTSQRFQTDMIHTQQIIAQLRPNTITLVGHSLGAGISLYINDHLPGIQHVYAINPAFNLRNLKESFGMKQNVSILRTTNDPVSTLSAFSGYNVKTIPFKTEDIIDSHKLNQFSF